VLALGPILGEPNQGKWFWRQTKSGGAGGARWRWQCWRQQHQQLVILLM